MKGISESRVACFFRAIRKIAPRAGSFFAATLIIFAAAHADNNVTLAWDPNPDQNIAGYRLRYGVTSGDYTQVLDVGNTSTGTVEGLVTDVTYFFVVTAYNADGLESPPSNEVSFTVAQSEELPSAPSDPSSDPSFALANTTFAGLVSGADAFGSFNGYLSLRTTSQGVATGQLTLGGQIYRWKSAFDALGRLAVTIDRGRWLPALTLMVQSNAEGKRITGTFTSGDSRATVDLQASLPATDRALATFQGRYTVVMVPDAAAPNEPQGYGIGSINISTRGAVRFSATLADGTKMRAGATIDATGAFSFHTPLYEETGFLAGNVIFEDIPGDSDAHATLLWSKPTRLRDQRFKPAFAIQLAMRAARYLHYLDSSPLLPGLAESSGHATISFSGGNLLGSESALRPSPVVVYMRGGEPTLWAFAQPITGTFDSTNGLFQGNFTPPDGRTRTFQGVLFQKEAGSGAGYGMFLDWTQSGRVDFAPRAVE